jgi:hypothetical protein
MSLKRGTPPLLVTRQALYYGLDRADCHRCPAINGVGNILFEFGDECLVVVIAALLRNSIARAIDGAIHTDKVRLQQEVQGEHLALDALRDLDRSRIVLPRLNLAQASVDLIGYLFRHAYTISESNCNAREFSEIL